MTLKKETKVETTILNWDFETQNFVDLFVTKGDYIELRHENQKKIIQT